MVPPTYLSPAGSGRLLYAAGHKMKERKLQMGITHAAGKRCVACWGPHAHTSPGEASLDCMIREAVRARASARINNVVRTTILIAAFQGGKQSARQSSEERRLTLLIIRTSRPGKYNRPEVRTPPGRACTAKQLAAAVHEAHGGAHHRCAAREL